jgi:hypothetical protein
MSIQIIDKKKVIFLVEGCEYRFMKPNFLYKDFGILITGKVKGSTLGWYIEGWFLSFNKIKEAVK